MKRKIAALLICAMLVAAVLPGAALACDVPTAQTETVSVTVPLSPEALRLELMVAAANTQILCLVRYAQLTPYDDVQWLLNAVDAAVQPVFAYADTIGAVVACEYTEYVVDGQTVLIDPIRVVKV